MCTLAHFVYIGQQWGQTVGSKDVIPSLQKTVVFPLHFLYSLSSNKCLLELGSSKKLT